MEQIYTNEYLSELLPAWNQALIKEGRTIELPLQRNFFHRKLKRCKEKTAVIISDAMRYEVGRELAQRLVDEADTTVETDEMLAVLPSYTRLGMAALLLQSSIALSRDGKELADGVYCPDLVSRQEVLRKEVPNSRCVQFASLKKMKRMELRSVFMGQQAVYIYHDQMWKVSAFVIYRWRRHSATKIRGSCHFRLATMFSRHRAGLITCMEALPRRSFWCHFLT